MVVRAQMSFVSVDYEREAFVFRLPDGLPVYTHYSFLFTALFVTLPLWFQGRLSSIVIALALAAILFLSILAPAPWSIWGSPGRSSRSTGWRQAIA
jgi:hypothetical protein